MQRNNELITLVAAGTSQSAFGRYRCLCVISSCTNRIAPSVLVALVTSIKMLCCRCVREVEKFIRLSGSCYADGEFGCHRTSIGFC
jgi:hypothetical protein